MRLDDLHALWRTDAEGLAAFAATGSFSAPDAVIVDAAPSSACGQLVERARAVARHRVLVWLSPPGQGHMEAELDAVLAGRPDGVVLPGCVDGRDIQQLGVKLAVREADCGWEAGSTAVIAAPSAAGLLALTSFRHASPRLQGLALLDPPADTVSEGGPTDWTPTALRRALLILGAVSAGIPAFDATAFAPGEDVGVACRQLRNLGVCGRVTRDAAAIASVHDAFGSHPPLPARSAGA